MSKPPITRTERRALAKFHTEREALFALLEHDRLTPLPDAVAHRGRAAIAGALRLLAQRRAARNVQPSGHRPAVPFPDTGPLLPADLFVALCAVTASLEIQFRERPQPLAKIYPRRSARA
jgi:hypothetical protein